MKNIAKYLGIGLLIVIVGLVGLSFTKPYRYLQSALMVANKGATIEDYKIFENRTVKASDKPDEWEKAKDYNKKQIPADLLKEVERYKTISFLVIQNGKLKYEQYWDGYSEISHSNSFSMAKSIISLLIGIAIEEGKIKSIDQKVADFIPEFKEGGKAEISIKDLLRMSSGLKWDENYASPLAEVVRAYFESDLYDFTANLSVDYQAGKFWEYQSCDSQLLGFVLIKATGKSLSAYASEKLWKPLGAKSDALWSLDKLNGDEKANCCFNINARDFARLGLMVLNKGEWKGKQIVPAKYIEEAISPANTLIDREDQSKTVRHYGYQFWIVYHKGLTIPCFRGVLGQYILIIPERNAIVVRLGHERDEEKINYTPKDVYTYLDIALGMLDK